MSSPQPYQRRPAELSCVLKSPGAEWLRGPRDASVPARAVAIARMFMSTRSARRPWLARSSFSQVRIYVSTVPELGELGGLVVAGAVVPDARAVPGATPIVAATMPARSVASTRRGIRGDARRIGRCILSPAAGDTALGTRRRACAEVGWPRHAEHREQVRHRTVVSETRATEPPPT